MANSGLGHPSWLEHAPYLFSLRKIMRTWKGEQLDFLHSHKTEGYTEEVFLQLEKQVAAHYTDTFCLYFGHAPMLPCQLYHQADPHYVPEVCE